MTGVLMVVAADAFNGERVLENSVRLITMLFGLPIALICLKFGWQSLRRGQPDRAWGTISYAFMLLVPAVGRAMSFGNPVNWVTTSLYIAGLIAAGVALYFRARWQKAWWTKDGRTPQENDDDTTD